jgi:hypothetical protein
MLMRMLLVRSPPAAPGALGLLYGHHGRITAPYCPTRPWAYCTVITAPYCPTRPRGESSRSVLVRAVENVATAPDTYPTATAPDRLLSSALWRSPLTIHKTSRAHRSMTQRWQMLTAACGTFVHHSVSPLHAKKAKHHERLAVLPYRAHCSQSNEVDAPVCLIQWSKWHSKRNTTASLRA